MRKTYFPLCLIFLLLAALSQIARAQTDDAARYKEYIADLLIFEDVKQYCIKPLADLLGPMMLIEGEVVSCAEPNGLPVVSVKDSQKWMPPDAVKNSVFTYQGGDPLIGVTLMIPATGDLVRMNQSNNPNNVKHPVIKFAPLKTIMGAPKSIVINRLIPPSDIQQREGEEIWLYKNEVVETKRETKMVTSQINGTFANETFSANETKFIPVELKRSVTRWDFQITIGSDGRVKNFTAKQPSYTAWTER